MNKKILDNFLDKEDIDLVKNLNLKKIQNNEVKVYHNKIYKTGNIETDCLSEAQIRNYEVIRLSTQQCKQM